MRLRFCILFSCAFCTLACDPRPQIEWFNATPDQISVNGDRFHLQIEPGRSARAAPGRGGSSVTIATHGAFWIYETRVPFGPEFGRVLFPSNIEIYKLQIEPDGEIIAVPVTMRPPVSREISQPKNFPLVPRLPPINMR
jgi:hypothetical protein